MNQAKTLWSDLIKILLGCGVLFGLLGLAVYVLKDHISSHYAIVLWFGCIGAIFYGIARYAQKKDPPKKP